MHAYPAIARQDLLPIAPVAERRILQWPAKSEESSGFAVGRRSVQRRPKNFTVSDTDTRVPQRRRPRLYTCVSGCCRCAFHTDGRTRWTGSVQASQPLKMESSTASSTAAPSQPSTVKLEDKATTEPLDQASSPTSPIEDLGDDKRRESFATAETRAEDEPRLTDEKAIEKSLKDEKDLAANEPSSGAANGEAGAVVSNGEKEDAGAPETPAVAEEGDAVQRKYLTGVPLMLLTFGLCTSTFVIALDNTIIATAIPKITTVSVGAVEYR